jgi:hypothetical protein
MHFMNAQVLNRASLAVSPKMEATQMEIFNLAYLGPLATLTSHLERLTPVATHRVGSKFTHSQIT